MWVGVVDTCAELKTQSTMCVVISDEWCTVRHTPFYNFKYQIYQKVQKSLSFPFIEPFLLPCVQSKNNVNFKIIIITIIFQPICLFVMVLNYHDCWMHSVHSDKPKEIDFFFNFSVVQANSHKNRLINKTWRRRRRRLHQTESLLAFIFNWARVHIFCHSALAECEATHP